MRFATSMSYFFVKQNEFIIILVHMHSKIYVKLSVQNITISMRRLVFYSSCHNITMGEIIWILPTLETTMSVSNLKWIDITLLWWQSTMLLYYLLIICRFMFVSFQRLTNSLLWMQYIQQWLPRYILF